MIQTLCYLLDALLTPENTPPDTSKEIYEHYFVFAAVWAFGGAMFQDQVCMKIIILWNLEAPNKGHLSKRHEPCPMLIFDL